MDTDLDTLPTALYVELTDRILPSQHRGARPGPGHPKEVTDAELIRLAVARVLLRFNAEHRWLRAAPAPVGPRLLSQPEYHRRLRAASALMEAALRWLARDTPTTAELPRLMDAPRCAAAPPGPPPGVRIWPGGPAMAATPPTTASTGAPTCC